MGTPTILVNASATDILIEADGLFTAIVGFSPMVTTSPLFEVNDLRLIE